MKKIKLVAGLLLSAFILAGCAAGYSSMKLDGISFQNSQEDDGIIFSYRYNVLNEFDNNRYAGFESDEDINVLSVRITNTTDSSIYLSERTLKVYAGDRQVSFLTPEKASDELSQNTYTYLLYGLIFLNIYDGESVTTLPIGLPIGLLNLFRAVNANSRFEDDMTEKNILNREVKPGQTFTGLTSLFRSNYEPLTFDFSRENMGPPPMPKITKSKPAKKENNAPGNKR